LENLEPWPNLGKLCMKYADGDCVESLDDMVLWIYAEHVTNCLPSRTQSIKGATDNPFVRYVLK